MPDSTENDNDVQYKSHAQSDGLELKDEGKFRAVFARFGVPDHDGDVTLPDAFTKGQSAPIVYAHNWGWPPSVGVGRIDFDGEKAWIDGEINLKMAEGRSVFESVKFAHERKSKQEYSYAYKAQGASRDREELKKYPEGTRRILKRLDVHEVSPVVMAAGIGTGTEWVKSFVKSFRGPYDDNVDYVLAGVEALHERTKSLADIRAKEGRTLAEEKRQRLLKIHQELGALISETAPATTADMDLIRVTAGARMARIARQLSQPIQ